MVVPAVITVILQRGKFPRPCWKLLGVLVGSGCVAFLWDSPIKVPRRFASKCVSHQCFVLVLF